MGRGRRRGAGGRRKSYAVGKTSASEGAPSGEALLDGDAATVWRAEVASEAWVVLHLGKLRPVRSISWQVGPEGLAGTLVVEASKDGKRWRVLGEVAGGEAGAWQTLRLREPIQARQVRLRLVSQVGATVLGGLAEVEVQGPGGKGAGGDHGGDGNGKPKGIGKRGPADDPRRPERQRRVRQRRTFGNGRLPD